MVGYSKDLPITSLEVDPSDGGSVFLTSIKASTLINDGVECLGRWSGLDLSACVPLWLSLSGAFISTNYTTLLCEAWLRIWTRGENKRKEKKIITIIDRHVVQLKEKSMMRIKRNIYINDKSTVVFFFSSLVFFLDHVVVRMLPFWGNSTAFYSGEPISVLPGTLLLSPSSKRVPCLLRDPCFCKEDL